MIEFEHDDNRLVQEHDDTPAESPSRWVEPMWSPETESDVLELREEVSEREAARRPWALVMDSGDLRDVARMLHAYGAPCVRLTSGEPLGDDVPRRLLVASGSRALDFDPRAIDKSDRVVTVALLSHPSKTLARQVRNMGFDYVLERPVHPDALRHLLHASLYRGDERRSELRFAAGLPVACRTGWRRHAATLCELSRFGCSLRIIDAPRLKGHLKVSLPPELTGKRTLTLAAGILRVERQGRGSLVNVAFRKDPKTRARVGTLLSQLRNGPAKLLT